MSTQEKPSFWKGYVLKAVIAALFVIAGYKVFVGKPSPEQPAPTQDELDSLSGGIELIKEAEPEPEAKPPADEAPPVAAAEPPPNLVDLVQPIVEASDALLPEVIEGYEGVSFDKLASFAYEVPLDPVDQ